MDTDRKMLSDNEKDFFEIHFFNLQKKGQFIFIPFYILLLFFLTKKTAYNLMFVQVTLIFLCSAVLGIFNVRSLHRFFIQNKANFKGIIKETLDLIGQTRGFMAYSKSIFAFDGQKKWSKNIDARKTAFRIIKRKRIIYMILYSLPVLWFTINTINSTYPNPIKPGYFVLYPLLLLLLANNFFWLLSFFYWKKRLANQ